MPSLPNYGPSSEELLLKSLETERSRRLTEDRLRYYTPYPKQAEFHSAGATHRERLLMAANQVGKTYAAAMELAAHACGQYPPGWQGYRFDRAIRAWAAGGRGRPGNDSTLVARRTGTAWHRLHSEVGFVRGRASARHCRARRHHSRSLCQR